MALKVSAINGEDVTLMEERRKVVNIDTKKAASECSL